MSAAGKRHLGRVAEQGCCICRRLGFGATPAEVHHARTGVGAAQRNGDLAQHLLAGAQDDDTKAEREMIVPDLFATLEEA